VLSGVQAGLSWSLVLKKREGYRRAFDKFGPEKAAHYTFARSGSLNVRCNRLRLSMSRDYTSMRRKT
jgi:hypothetical protein